MIPQDVSTRRTNVVDKRSEATHRTHNASPIYEPKPPVLRTEIQNIQPVKLRPDGWKVLSVRSKIYTVVTPQKSATAHILPTSSPPQSQIHAAFAFLQKP